MENRPNGVVVPTRNYRQILRDVRDRIEVDLEYARRELDIVLRMLEPIPKNLEPNRRRSMWTDQEEYDAFLGIHAIVEDGMSPIDAVEGWMSEDTAKRRRTREAYLQRYYKVLKETDYAKEERD